jgi:hypothetical protein
MSPAPATKEASENLLDTARYTSIGAALTAVTNWVASLSGADMPGEVAAALTLIYGTGLQWMVIKRKDAAAKKRADAKKKPKAEKKPDEPPKPEGSEG